MNYKKNFSSELALLLGILLNSFCVSLMVKSNFGISTISSVPFVLSDIFSKFSFGFWNFLIQSASILILIIVTKKFKIGYLISFVIAVIFSELLDLDKVILASWPNTLNWRVIYFVVAFFVLTYGASLFIKCKLPILPFDTFVRDMTQYLKVPVKRVKTSFDLVCLAITLAFSLAMLGYIDGVGLGTILCAIFTGIITNHVCDYLEHHYSFQPTIYVVKKILYHGKPIQTK
ncbi:DUF6198 family protein [Clostridium estertheticum]|uniref:DUF6198 family protein n=1 Tax=Clostridium estertheticum TaxID=238834 RepID=UPI001CF3E3D7|nr:DUF6198 family protein [Clostridium estertheticum]MCB2356178.1 DUF6198 family protein [Clostridium estertheticum]WAG43674.1 DUF6198 family protein [Clostridium estertheticum]